MRPLPPTRFAPFLPRSAWPAPSPCLDCHLHLVLPSPSPWLSLTFTLPPRSPLHPAPPPLFLPSEDPEDSQYFRDRRDRRRRRAVDPAVDMEEEEEQVRHTSRDREGRQGRGGAGRAGMGRGDSAEQPSWRCWFLARACSPCSSTSLPLSHTLSFFAVGATVQNTPLLITPFPPRTLLHLA